MKNRLTELLTDAKSTYPTTSIFDEHLASYLLTNGVIVPPCKIGDVIYHLHRYTEKITPVRVAFILFDEGGVQLGDGILLYHMDEFGKTIFLTREEAEQALKEATTNG